jgi:urate oxidase
MALEYQGSSHEGFTVFLGRRFLETYPQMQSLRLIMLEAPFAKHSDKLLSPLEDDFGTVVAEIGRDGIRSLICGRRNLRLVKLTGSAFRDFARDAYTTLPEARDRPLFVYLDVHWRYAHVEDAISEGSSRIPSETVRDAVIATFDDFVSMSIQHLVHEMGMRLLNNFPGLVEVSFEAQNRLWDTSKSSESDPTIRVFSDPKPAHGLISLTLKRDA